MFSRAMSTAARRAAPTAKVLGAGAVMTAGFTAYNAAECDDTHYNAIAAALTGVQATVRRLEKHLGTPLEEGWWMTYGSVDFGNANNTEDHLYRSYNDLPPMVHTDAGGKHRSLMTKYLTPELFEKLKNKKTKKGYTLSHAIQTGVMTPHLGVGITAGDEESWTVFKDIMNPIIKGWHGYDPETEFHKSDLNPENVNMTPSQAERFNSYVVSTRIRAARNLSGYSLPAGASPADRHGVAVALQKAFSKFEGDLKGTYYDLGSMTPKQSDFLRDNGFLFQKPKPTNLLSYCGAARNWPDDRGIFHNDSCTALAWCNEEDHCRIISMSTDGNVKAVFARFCNLSHAIKGSVEADGGKFMYSDKLGFLGTCPSNLGTGLRASVMIKLPELNKDVLVLEEVCDSFDLQPRGSAGEHSAAVGAKWDISNKQRIGFTEAQLVQKMVDGVDKLITIEEKLASGKKIKKGVDY